MDIHNSGTSLSSIRNPNLNIPDEQSFQYTVFLDKWLREKLLRWYMLEGNKSIGRMVVNLVRFLDPKNWKTRSGIPLKFQTITSTLLWEAEYSSDVIIRDITSFYTSIAVKKNIWIKFSILFLCPIVQHQTTIHYSVVDCVNCCWCYCCFLWLSFWHQRKLNVHKKRLLLQ